MSSEKVVVLAGLLFLPGVALAQSVLSQRCTIDNSSASQAEARVEWMRRCALQNVNPGAWFDTGLAAGNGGTLRDYQEGDPNTNGTGRNMYTSPMDYYEINYSYISKLYLSGTTYQEVDARGHYKWSRSATRKKTAIYYPLYGTTYDVNATGSRQLFPHPTLADCNFYFDRYGAQPATGQDFYLNGFCDGVVVPPTALTNGVALSPLGAPANSIRYYTLAVPAGATKVTFEVSGGTGDVDLFVKYSSPAEIGSYDCRPFRAGNNEACVMSVPQAGTWHISLIGYSSYSGVTLKGTWSY